LAQAQGLDALLEESRAFFAGAFLLEAPQDLLLKRLTGRRTCRACGAVYHILFAPPVTEGVCDQCGGTDLYQREDDKEATILNRLSIFEKQTAPLIEFYQQRNRLWRINADGDRARILADLRAALKEAGQ
jgi:adenylate kinase